MAQSFQTNKIAKIAIVGGGPCGIYCACQILKKFEELNFKNFSINIFDKSQILRTILPTGGGRCNLTNAQEDIEEFIKNFPRGGKFLYSLFSRHSNFDAINFFNEIGIKTYTQSDKRVFPQSNSAKEVKDKLLNFVRQYKNTKFINKKINSIKEVENYDKIIICAGSKGTKPLLESIKIPFFDFKPSLTALKIENQIYPQGVSINSIDGDFIFTHQGVSGPLIYKISAQNIEKKFPYEIQIKLFNFEDLLTQTKENPKKSIGNIVSKFCAKSFTIAHLKNLKIDFNKNACEISKKDLEKLSNLNLKIISNCKGEQIVNAGGVDLKYLDKNCKSKLFDNIWFCGEILNIDGYCGGFNLQNCWSSAYVTALDVVDSIISQQY